MITDVNISDAERVVIETLWSLGPMTALEVAKELASENDWSIATVKTLLGRLLKKKAIAAKPQGRRFIYEAKMSRDEYVGAQSERLVDKLFGGRIAPLVSHFAETKGLTAKDVEELRQLLDRLQ
ncbi:MAG: CopY family transcriptional repressor [Gammaproteobacteria bacterium]|nr:CopY family transcriptional repressor [Gammaproteobacteria bacterium]